MFVNSFVYVCRGSLNPKPPVGTLSIAGMERNALSREAGKERQGLPSRQQKQLRGRGLVFTVEARKVEHSCPHTLKVLYKGS